MAARVVAITGCTRGIGRALLGWFAANGHKVAGCGTDPARVESLRALHPTCLVSAVDVRDEAAVAAWLEDASSRLGAIDLLVCNAGVLPPHASLWEVPAETWARACEVNVLGTARVLRLGVPRLRAPGAAVVLMSSRYGRSTVCGQGCYSATKWSTEAMAKTLALELRGRGITVVSLDPGLVDTDMFRSSNPSGAACGQRDPAEFAAETGPFLLSLELADTGRNLTCKGSPASYFQTGVPYKDRPAWANGFGAFVRARDDPDPAEAAPQRPGSAGAADDDGAEPPAKRRQRAAGAPPLRYFVSGVMLGSRRQLADASADLAPQDYRARLARAIRRADPAAVVVEPLDVVKARAAAGGQTLEELSQSDAQVRESFVEVVDLASTCDVVISNLPEASMGSAVELWEARRAGRLVLTVSPMKDNWLLRSVTHRNFADLDDLEKNLSACLRQEKLLR